MTESRQYQAKALREIVRLRRTGEAVFRAMAYRLAIFADWLPLLAVMVLTG